MNKLINGIHHTAIKCTNGDIFRKVIEFYTETLGLEFLRIWGDGNDAGAMLTCGDSVLEIFASGGTGVIGAVEHIAFKTDCPDDCIQAVRKIGLDVTMEPTDLIIPSDAPFPIRVAFCRGFAGELIEFFYER